MVMGMAMDMVVGAPPPDQLPETLLDRLLAPCPTLTPTDIGSETSSSRWPWRCGPPRLVG